MNWIQITQNNAGRGKRRAELQRSARRQQLIIKVSSWQFYNQKEEVLNQKLLWVIDRYVFNNLAVDNAVKQQITSTQAGFSIEGGTRRLIAAYLGIYSRLLCV